MTTALDEQAARLDAILPWARLAGELQHTVRPHEQLVHLRPSASQIRLIDLDPARPQLDRGSITTSLGAADQLRALLASAPDNQPNRPTPEKKLQSWLLARAYKHDRRLLPLSRDLTLVTDEQVLLTETSKIVVDLLAVRETPLGLRPVVIELKSKRELTRLVAQLNAAAPIVDAHRERFARVFAALLAREVQLIGPCEKWMVWSATHDTTESRAAELAAQGIVVKGYRAHGETYTIV
jgi:hypothetical protein